MSRLRFGLGSGFSWKVFIDGEPVREAEANDPTVRVHLDEELANLNEGTVHTLEIRLVYHDEYVAADTTVRFSNLGERKSERGPHWLRRYLRCEVRRQEFPRSRNRPKR